MRRLGRLKMNLSKKAPLLSGAIRAAQDPKIDATLEHLPIPQGIPTSFDIAE